MADTNNVAERKYQVEVMDKLGESILKKYNKWVYWNEPQHNFPTEDDWKDRYWGGLDNYNKLLSVKQQYDPNNTFTCYHCVGYVRDQNEIPSVCAQDKCTCTNTPNECANTANILNKSDRLFFNSKLLNCIIFSFIFDVLSKF